MYVVVVLLARRRLGNTCVALSTGSVEPLLSIATVVAKVDVSMAHVIMSPSKSFEDCSIRPVSFVVDFSYLCQE
jgi:hypothetical protein